MKGLSLLRRGVPLCIALGLVWACGSSAKKTAVDVPQGDAGDAGATSEGGAAGDSNANGGAGNAVNNGGAAGESTPGEGGASGELGEGGAGGAAPVFHGLYIGTDGLDTNGGTQIAPFLTLAHAVSVAQPGDTIVFLDGTFAAQPSANIPDGVHVMAENTGGAKLKCAFANLLTFAGTNRVEGLEFDNCAQPIVATSGKLTMVDLYFVGAGAETGAVHLSGGVAATLTGSANHVYTLGGYSIFFVEGTATLSVTGGTFKNGAQAAVSGNGLFRTAGSSKLTLKDVTLVDNLQPAVSTGGTSVATLDHVTMDLLANMVVLLRDNSSLFAKNGTRIALKPAAPTRYECIRSELASGTISLADTEVTGCSAAINSIMPTTLSIVNSKLHHNDGLALDLASYQAAISTLTITNSEFSDNGSVSTQIHGAIRLGVSVLNAKFRGVTIKNNGGVFTDATGMYLSASIGSTFDFGTLAEPGLNTFQSNGVGMGMRFQNQGQAGTTVQAVGNIWTPNLQGAGGDGKYVVPVGAGKTLEVTGPTSAQLNQGNYNLSSTTTLVLAELP